MKTAQVSDVWRRLSRRPFPVRYDTIEFKGVRRIGAATVGFKPGITAVVGGNGVGKSTLMATIVRSLGPATSAHTKRLFESADLEIKGTLTCNPNETVAKTSLDGESVVVAPADLLVPKHHWIDPSTYATRVQALILNDADFSTNLEGIDPEKYDETDCEAMSYIVGKKYADVEVYEIEYADAGVVPYFRVKSEGIEYDSAQMGLGELSLFLIYWALRAIAKETIVLIEEPETHVSPRSQEHLINVCARLSLQKGLHLIITTHSPFITSRIPREHIRLLIREGTGVGVVPSPTYDQVARILGDRLNYHGVLLVEDAMGSAVLRAILRGLSPELLEYYEVASAESNDGIKRCIENVPGLETWFSQVGIFDADQRAPLGGETFPWPHTFLPGDGAPEALLQQIILQQPAQVAPVLGCTTETLNVACQSAEGHEEHEWVRKVREALALDLDSFADRLVQHWLTAEENKAACKDLIATLQDNAFLIRTPD